MFRLLPTLSKMNTLTMIVLHYLALSIVKFQYNLYLLRIHERKVPILKSLNIKHVEHGDVRLVEVLCENNVLMFQCRRYIMIDRTKKEVL